MVRKGLGTSYNNFDTVFGFLQSELYWITPVNAGPFNVPRNPIVLSRGWIDLVKDRLGAPRSGTDIL